MYLTIWWFIRSTDMVTIEEIDQLARMPHSIVGSVAKELNIAGPLEDDLLKQRLWQYLGLTRVYTKRKGTDTAFMIIALQALSSSDYTHALS